MSEGTVIFAGGRICAIRELISRSELEFSRMVTRWTPYLSRCMSCPTRSPLIVLVYEISPPPPAPLPHVTMGKADRRVEWRGDRIAVDAFRSVLSGKYTTTRESIYHIYTYIYIYIYIYTRYLVVRKGRNELEGKWKDNEKKTTLRGPQGRMIIRFDYACSYSPSCRLILSKRTVDSTPHSTSVFQRWCWFRITTWFRLSCINVKNRTHCKCGQSRSITGMRVNYRR